MALDEISNAFALGQPLKRIKGPLSFRQALGVSQSQMGKLLGHFGGRAYTQATVSIWERVERGVRLPVKYTMRPDTREAYRALLAAVIEMRGEGRFQLQARMGPRRWRFRLLARCHECGKWFVVARTGQVRCRRCIAKGRR